MIRYRLNPIIFLINNDGYLVERDIGEGPFNDLQRWKYAQLPHVFGDAWSAVVRTEGELERALPRAWKKTDGLSFIEVITDKWDSPKSMIKAGAAMAKTNFID
jgi:indolepyruvate decarboxylase